MKSRFQGIFWNRITRNEIIWSVYFLRCVNILLLWFLRAIPGSLEKYLPLEKYLDGIENKLKWLRSSKIYFPGVLICLTQIKSPQTKWALTRLPKIHYCCCKSIYGTIPKLMKWIITSGCFICKHMQISHYCCCLSFYK